MKYAEKTAIGIVTCDRPEMIKRCLDSIKHYDGRIYIINAGKQQLNLDSKEGYTVLNENGNSSNIPVGWAKNQLVRSIRENKENEYIFLIEDDIEILDCVVFEKYIDTAIKTGLWGCLSYAGSGKANRDSEGQITPLESVKYDENITVDLYRNSPASFTLFHRNIFREIGFFDERFINAAEHLDFYVEQFVKGLAPHFWFFPDIHESWKYLKDMDDSLEKSVIRKDPNFQQIMRTGWEEFKKKRNMYPHQIPMVDKNLVLERLTNIEKNYGK